ncbi:MAG: tyrosine-type recombinase/integrase [Oscillospiraceae bacterium]|jgi:integrase/recombinase XerD
MFQEKEVRRFARYLAEEEKSAATIEKYLRDVRRFIRFAANQTLNKTLVLQYKSTLHERYAAASVNSMLTALNSFLRFTGCLECCVKLLKIQRQIFCAEEKELCKQEYQRLLKAAKNSRISLIIQTICCTGIRVSELNYISVEAVRCGKAVVNCKNKTRVIFIPAPLQKLLNAYIRKTGIQTGSVFVSRNGNPLNRSNIWRDMKALCQKAGVSPSKVYPHNLRHLFARTFYSLEHDIAKLADLLGHSSINTTRIYIMETGRQHISRLEQMQLALTT